MSATQYFIVRSDDEWKIRFRDELFGPYKTKDEAFLFAVDAAREIGRRKNSAEVLVEDVPDHFVTKWTYGDAVHVPLG